MKSQVLHTMWCNITGDSTGQIWNWSLLGVKGLKRELHWSKSSGLPVNTLGLERLPPGVARPRSFRMRCACCSPCQRICSGTHARRARAAPCSGPGAGTSRARRHSCPGHTPATTIARPPAPGSALPTNKSRLNRTLIVRSVTKQ